MPKNYWMIVTGLEVFRATSEAGFRTQRLMVRQRKKAQRVERGDRLLYYISVTRYFGAIVTATSPYFEQRPGQEPEEGLPYGAFGVNVQPDMVLAEEDFIDARELAPRLEYVRKWTPEQWYMAFAQSRLHLLPKRDFLLVEEEMRKILTRNPDRGHLSPTAPQAEKISPNPRRGPERRGRPRVTTPAAESGSPGD